MFSEFDLYGISNCSQHFLDVIKVLEDGDLQTLGLLDYDKRLAHSFSAHPKVDPFTGKNEAIVYFIFGSRVKFQPLVLLTFGCR